jgi:hypothetical protein
VAKLSTVLQDAANRLERALVVEREEFEAFVVEKRTEFANMEKVIQGLRQQANSSPSTAEWDSKLSKGKTRKSQGSASHLLRLQAKLVVRENGGSMKRADLIARLLELHFESADPEQLVRRALERATDLRLIDDAYHFVPPSNVQE